LSVHPFNILLINRYERQVHDIHIVAFYLDPVNVGIPVDHHNERRIYNFFKDITDSSDQLEELHTHFTLFNQSLTLFEQPTLADPHSGALCWNYKLDPRKFWIAAMHHAPVLGKLGNRIFQAPANSVPSERSFSTQNFLHSKARNRLDPIWVDKLTYIYMNSRVLCGKDSIINNYVDLETLTPEEAIELEDQLLQDEGEGLR
jgi:hAT family C-terminal dimerisation region